MSPSLDEGVARRLERLAADDVVGRIWRRDHTVWKPDPTEIADRLGWLLVSAEMREKVASLDSFREKAVADGFRTAVLLGMGGSSLAPEVLAAALGTAPGALSLIVLDSTHPAAVASVESSVNLDETLFIVASKSGTTAETLSHFAYFRDRAGRGDRFVAITDPGSPLEALARDEGFREIFLNPPDIGGRYSALSLFGLVPAAMIGANIRGLLDGADEMARACGPSVPIEENDGARLGAAMGEAALAGRDKLTLVLPDDIASFGGWVEQLIAESTGKEGKGILPVVGEGLSDPDSYPNDRLFVYLGGAEEPSPAALETAGHPVVRLGPARPSTLGAEFFRWEFATAVAGHILGIQPFDQPNVAEAKEATKEILSGGDVESPDPGDPHELLGALRPGDYVAIQAYLEPDEANRAALQRARQDIRNRHRVATTVGFGPRFLHSTGQLHKGGPDTGAFIQVVDEARDIDRPIPGKPYTFGNLIDAQALGDLRSLRARDRRVVRATLEQIQEVT